MSAEKFGEAVLAPGSSQNPGGVTRGKGRHLSLTDNVNGN